jgi:hypothetical protein
MRFLNTNSQLHAMMTKFVAPKVVFVASQSNASKRQHRLVIVKAAI